MKALFIIQCQDPICGASRSLSMLIQNLDADVDLIFPHKVKNEGKITKQQIQKFYGPRVKNVWFLWQPARLTVMEEHFPVKVHIKNFVKEFLYGLEKFKYKAIFKNGNYDFIHLNSVILYPMLDKRWPMFLHVREAVRNPLMIPDKLFSKTLKQAHGIISINPSAAERVPKDVAPSLMLINPFDQTSVANVDLLQARAMYGLSGKETVYAIIGTIIDYKGVDFVIRAFQKAKMENSVLLVVGNDARQDEYIQYVKELAAGDTRIRFTGEIERTETVYRVIDYVVRGDTSAGLGRTLYEALYSGCGVINPMDKITNSVPNCSPEMRERVYFYPLRDEAALTRAFEETQEIRFEQRSYYSNVKEYMKEFLQFINENK